MYKKIDFKNRRLKLNLSDEAGLSVANEIFKYREYRGVEDIIKMQNGVIIDAGAHLGLFAIYAKVLNENAKIYCLEPEKNNLEILQQNLTMNNVVDVTILPLALASEVGSRELIISPDSHNHKLTRMCHPREGGGPRGELITTNLEERGTKTIFTTTVSELIKKYNWPMISLLKMDIEGAEREVINSLSAEDYSHLQNIVLEYHENYGVKVKMLEKIIRENGFSVQIFPSQFDKEMGILLARNKRIR